MEITNDNDLRFQVSVFPAAASLQTGFPLRSNTFQLLCFFFLTPDTRHLKPCDLVLVIWDFGLRISNCGFHISYPTAEKMEKP